jgi:adenosylhomocysteine nucleosidase
MEFRGLLSRAANPRPAQAPVDWARRVGIGSHDALLVANGVGAGRAAAAVDAGLGAFRAQGVVSTGYCGGLEPDLKVGDVVVGTCITAGERRYPAQPLTSKTPHRAGIVCTIDHVAGTSEEKARLRASGASVVEMEAGGVAERTVTRGLPFYCVRSITDLAGEDMANDFNGALRADGHFDTILILKGALRHPCARLPELIRLRQRCVLAASVLGDFIADCRF